MRKCIWHQAPDDSYAVWYTGCGEEYGGYRPPDVCVCGKTVEAGPFVLWGPNRMRLEGPSGAIDNFALGKDCLPCIKCGQLVPAVDGTAGLKRIGLGPDSLFYGIITYCDMCGTSYKEVSMNKDGSALSDETANTKEHSDCSCLSCRVAKKTSKG